MPDAGHGVGRSAVSLARLPLTTWVLLCAAAEAIGMTAAALAATWSQAAGSAGVARPLLLAVVVAGGLVEGAALGGLQAFGLHLALPELNRLRWFAVTVAVAGFGWAAASAPSALSASSSDALTADPAPAAAAVVAGAAVLGAAMGTLLGAVQAWCLHGVVRRPRRWILANAVAWVPAMIIIFLGARSSQATWPPLAVGALGAATGAAAGVALGLVTGWFMPTLEDRAVLRNARPRPARHA